ncbi:MAG: hypothetical protein ACOC9Y_08565 [Chloroflexota bacterium]
MVDSELDELDAPLELAELDAEPPLLELPLFDAAFDPRLSVT